MTAYQYIRYFFAFSSIAYALVFTWHSFNETSSDWGRTSTFDLILIWVVTIYVAIVMIFTSESN